MFGGVAQRVHDEVGAVADDGGQGRGVVSVGGDEAHSESGQFGRQVVPVPAGDVHVPPGRSQARGGGSSEQAGTSQDDGTSLKGLLRGRGHQDTRQKGWRWGSR